MPDSAIFEKRQDHMSVYESKFKSWLAVKVWLSFVKICIYEQVLFSDIEINFQNILILFVFIEENRFISYYLLNIF